MSVDWHVALGDHSYDEGNIAVKTDTGEIVRVNADDIGKDIKAIGEGIAKIGNGIAHTVKVSDNTLTPIGSNTSYRPIYINGQANPFTYIEETSSGTTCTPWTTVGINTASSTTTVTKDSNHLAWSDEFMAAGPARTATYRTNSDTDNYVTLNWHFDWDIPETAHNHVWAYERYGHDPELEKKRKIAEDKSMQLLKNWLSETEYNYLMEEGNLELPSQHEKDTIYIVNKDPTKRIGIKKAGKVIEKSLCIHTDYSYATGDQLLANIMLLKSDEKKFLEIANVHNYFAD